jgi:hypothetical protein
MSLEFSNDLQQLREEGRVFVASMARLPGCEASACNAELRRVRSPKMGMKDGRHHSRPHGSLFAVRDYDPFAISDQTLP